MIAVSFPSRRTQSCDEPSASVVLGPASRPSGEFAGPDGRAQCLVAPLDNDSYHHRHARSGLTALMIASEIVSLWMVGGDRPIFITSPANKRFGKASTVNEALSPSLTLPMSILADINFDLHGGKIRSDEEERRHP